MNKPQDNHRKIRVGITHGDFNGIGYELIINTLSDNRLLEMFTPIVYGSAKIASYYKKMLNANDLNLNILNEGEKIIHKKANLINIYDKEEKIEIGKSTRMAGDLAFKSLESAIEGIKMQNFDVLVTAPINKKNIQSEKFDFPGHTEYLAKKFNTEDFLMLMVCDNLRLGVITGHMALKDVPSALTTDLIIRKVRIMNESLMKDFGIRKPKIALLALNPHAGDDGLLGKEENEIILPAIKMASEENILTFGPYPADGFIGSRSYQNFDGVLAMYHDQGMVAFKSLAFDSGVNYTAGLPIIRTSPAHGTAYDLVGKNIASTESFRKAIYLAIDIFNNRNMHEHITRNPLLKNKDKLVNDSDELLKRQTHK